MKQQKTKYRVTVYLGKDKYETLTKMADTFKLPLPSLVRLMIDTGFQFADTMGDLRK